MHILIIEDNKSLQNHLKASLMTQARQVQGVSSYGEALKAIKKGAFDVYIIDILLPDNKGYELLKKIDKNQTSQIILMSGLFDESSILKYIPKDLKEICVFMKKPLDEKTLIEAIDEVPTNGSVNKSNEDITLNKLHKNLSSYSLKPFLEKFKTFDSQEIISILFLAFKSKFSGLLTLHIDNEKDCFIEFSEGSITKLVSEDSESYFGALLVEHGLSLTEDIAEILEDPNESSKFLGERMVEKSLLSPYMLNFILKEQFKIRLTQIISHISFQVSFSEKEITESDTKVIFNEKDIIDWSIDCLETKIKDTFFKNFYDKNKNYFLEANESPYPIKSMIYNNKSFLEKFNIFSNKIKQSQTLESLLKDSKDFREELEFIYFGILTESFIIKDIKKSKDPKIKNKEIIENILEKKVDDFYGILNLPYKATQEEIKNNYKKLKVITHPDNLPKTALEALVENYQEAFHRVEKSYEILSNNAERESYIKNKEGHSILKILTIYKKGISFIKSNNFQKGFEVLKTIEDNNQSPSDICLYLLWAEIQLSRNLTNNKNQAGFLKQKMEKCPMDLKISPLFWFINGLYYKKIHNYEKALTLFNKTVKLDKNFKEAHQEIINTQNKFKEEFEKLNNNNGFFSKLLNKKSG